MDQRLEYSIESGKHLISLETSKDLIFKAVQVLDLVEYTGSDGSELESIDDDGVLIMTEEDKTFITIDDVQINVEDLPEEGQGIFGRLQRLNQKKANLTLDLEEFSSRYKLFSQ